MSNRKSATKSPKRSDWAENEAIPSESQTNTGYSNVESSNINSDSESSTDALTIPPEQLGYFSKDYKDVICRVHVTGDPEFWATKKSNNKKCILYLIPYTEDEYEHLKKLQPKTDVCPFLLNYSRIEKKDDWILIEYPWVKNMLDIFDEMNPDYGFLRDVRRDNFDEATIRTILKDVLQALQFIHKLGYVHMVVRAVSVYINSVGRVLLGNIHMIRRPNELYLTTPYAHMSPEMIAKLPNLNLSTELRAGLSSGFGYKTDSWSIGLFLIELIHLIDIDEYYDRRFERFTDQKLAECILSGKTPWFTNIDIIGGRATQIAAWKQTLSPLLYDFYKRCMQKQNARWSVDRLLRDSLIFRRTPDMVEGSSRGHQSSRRSGSSKKRSSSRKMAYYPTH